MQQYGTEYRRAPHENYWADKGMQAALERQYDGELVIFDDVRFVNEAEAIKWSGGIIVRVVTPRYVRQERLGGTLPEEHASETEMNGYLENDFIIEGRASKEHEDTLSDILAEATFEDVDFMEAISESLTNRE